LAGVVNAQGAGVFVLEAAAVDYLIAWARRRGGRVGERPGDQIDLALDAGLERLHEVVAGKLGTDPALSDLQEQAAGGEVGRLTRQRADEVVRAAAADEPEFAIALHRVLAGLSAADPSGVWAAGGPGSVARPYPAG
jgi:hypothetical protein